MAQRKPPDNRSTHERMRALLLEYALTADIKKAAERAGIARSVHYKWLKKPGYAKAFHATRQQAGEALEAIAVERHQWAGRRMSFTRVPSAGPSHATTAA